MCPLCTYWVFTLTRGMENMHCSLQAIHNWSRSPTRNDVVKWLLISIWMGQMHFYIPMCFNVVIVCSAFCWKCNKMMELSEMKSPSLSGPAGYFWRKVYFGAKSIFRHMDHGLWVAVCYLWMIGRVGKNRWTSIFRHWAESIFRLSG